MNILIDINHPAHVHYFRNFIRIMQEHGYSFVVINRDDEMINQLLDYYKIEHHIRNIRPSKTSAWKSISYLVKSVYSCIQQSLKVHVDMYIGFGSAIASITALLFRKPCILLDDTEHNTLNHKLYLPGASVVLTPFYYNINLGPKQLRFQAYVEQLYMHSRYFALKKDTLEELGLVQGEYVLVRYISYTAHHDKNVKSVQDDTKKEIIRKLSAKYKVLLSMENKSNGEFYEPYIVHFSPEKMHDVMAGAKFIVAEGATMASEAFTIGVPYVYINPLKVGYINEEEVWKPLYFRQTVDSGEILKDIDDLMALSVDSASLKAELEAETIDPTEFLVWFVEHYPQSASETRTANATGDKTFWERFK